MYGPDLFHARQVGNGPRQFERTVKGAGRKMQLLHGGFKQTLGVIIRLAILPYLAWSHVGIADQGRTGEAGALLTQLSMIRADDHSTHWRFLTILAIGGLPWVRIHFRLPSIACAG